MLRTYRALFVAQIQASAQYRAQSFLWLLLTVVRPVVFLAAWTAVAEAQGGQVGGYSVGDFAAYYVCLTLAIQLTMTWNAWDFELEIQQGKLSPKLLRPLHPVHYALVENLVWKGVTLIGLLPVLMVIAWSFGATFRTQWWHVVLFLPSIVLAMALNFLFGWVVASVAFWTTRVEPWPTVMDRFRFLLAGQVAPMALLPGPLQVLAFVLPFGYQLGVPAEILRGGTSFEQTLLLMLGQVVWLGITFVAFKLVWQRGVRQYSAVGA